jgi:hypothetical protein
MPRTETEKVVVMELSKSDIKEIHRAVRGRSEMLSKMAKKLRGMSRHAEADGLEATVADLNERLATQFAAELDVNTGEIKKQDDGK